MRRTFIGVLCLSVLVVAFIACGGGGDSCAFDVHEFTNGANASVTDSVWNCTSSNSSYTFAFYDDGTGYSSALGAFTWIEVGCGAVDVAAYNGTNHITDIAGSIASGIGTFTQTLGSTSVNASCTLGSLSASVVGSSKKGYAQSHLLLAANCENSDFAKALNLTELESELWLVRNSADNTVSATFIEGSPFRMFGAECNLDDNSEIVCKANECTFKYK